MNTSAHDAFAVTPTGKHAATAILITATGKPFDRARPFQVCRACFSPRQGGGLIQDGACSRGCGVCEPQEGEPA